MHNTTYQTTPNRFVTARGARYAYRTLGDKNQPTLLLLTHLAATMDNWDPLVLNTLSQNYHVIVFDNKGVGLTGGTVQSSMEGMAQGVLAFMDAMRLNRVHLLGLSMGGMIAQELVKLAPERVEKLILAGTGPKGGVGIENIRPTTHFLTFKALRHAKDPKFYLFFNQDKTGRTKATQFLNRLKERTATKDKNITLYAYHRQLNVIKQWGQANENLMEHIQVPTLIVNGDNDKMVPTENTYVLAQHINNAKLIVYPNAGHGSLFQEPEQFCKDVVRFLETK